MFLVDMCFTDMAKITPELAAQHQRYLAKEYQSNNLLFGGRKVPRTGGILISQHECEQALRTILDADPFIQSGAVSYSITEFTPVMAAEAYAHLLA
ncbi:YciI family protein [Photobacterium sp. MCCC 1A19761]|uniref:YciI family protein n=1 Tax=Photobacterium sp. MCCC 1A19761 TaxID=3115000 RepID=UPI00307DE553